MKVVARMSGNLAPVQNFHCWAVQRSIVQWPLSQFEPRVDLSHVDVVAGSNACCQSVPPNDPPPPPSSSSSSDRAVGADGISRHLFQNRSSARKLRPIVMTTGLPSGVKNKWNLSTQELHGGQTWMLCGDKYVADFSVTTNGLGTPKNGMDALLPSALDISHYPSADCEEALAALGKYVPFQFSVAVRMHTACSRFNADLSGTWRGPATASSSATAPASS